MVSTAAVYSSSKLLKNMPGHVTLKQNIYSHSENLSFKHFCSCSNLFYPLTNMLCKYSWPPKKSQKPMPCMFLFFFRGYLSLRPEGSENIPILLQEADLYFSNQNDLRNPKMGSKQSVVVPTVRWFFQITFLGTKNHWKNPTVSLLINSLVILTP